MQKSHLETLRRYEPLRKEARGIAHSLLPRYLKEAIALSSIESRELSAFRTWQDDEARKVIWDWHFATRYTFVSPKAFDLSVWQGNRLLSLSIGRPTYSGRSMRLDFIERAPGYNIFSGEMFGVSQAAFETYGRLIGAKYLRVMEPMNKKLIEHYTSKDAGFTFMKAAKGVPHYLVKSL